MFAQRLRQLRLKKALTQGDLAAVLGVSASTIGMYEQGRREPDSAMLQKICRYFNVTLDNLMGEESGPADVDTMIEDMRGRMMAADGLMFNGVPLEQEDIEKLIDAIRLSANIVLETNKRRKEGN